MGYIDFFKLIRLKFQESSLVWFWWGLWNKNIVQVIQYQNTFESVQLEVKGQ